MRGGDPQTASREAVAQPLETLRQRSPTVGRDLHSLQPPIPGLLTAGAEAPSSLVRSNIADTLPCSQRIPRRMQITLMRQPSPVVPSHGTSVARHRGNRGDTASDPYQGLRWDLHRSCSGDPGICTSQECFSSVDPPHGDVQHLLLGNPFGAERRAGMALFPHGPLPQDDQVLDCSLGGRKA